MKVNKTETIAEIELYPKDADGEFEYQKFEYFNILLTKKALIVEKKYTITEYDEDTKEATEKKFNFTKAYKKNQIIGVSIAAPYDKDDEYSVHEFCIGFEGDGFLSFGPCDPLKAIEGYTKIYDWLFN